MENPAESGAGKKPPRANARSGSAARKSAPSRRPAAKRPAPKTAAAKVAPSTAPEQVDAAAVAEVELPPATEEQVPAPVEPPAPEPDAGDELPVPEEDAAADAAGEAVLAAEDDAEEDPEDAALAAEIDAEPAPADSEIDEETRERPVAAVEPDLDEADDEVSEAPEDDDPDDPDPDPDADPELDDETRERPVIEGDEAPDGSASNPTAAATAATAAALAGVASWTRRVATVTGARVGTFSRSTAASVRARTAAAAARRAEAATRAEEARQERAAARDVAVLEAATASHPTAEATLTFDLVAPVNPAEHVLSVSGLTKSFDDKVAVSGIDLRVHPGDFYGIVGPNGAGKTTTLSMISGLLRPDAGTVHVHGSDVWNDPVAAKRNIGVLPDRLRLFDRLTGAQLLYYAGVLRGLDAATVKGRTADLARAFGLEQALARLVSDHSAGMTKKIALAAAMIHSPRLLVLDEPFESVDPVSAANVTRILKQYVAAGGTVVLSSHSMDLVQRICDHVAVVVGGVILVDGTIDEVRNGRTLEERFVELAGGRTSVEGLEWLHSFSDGS